MKCEKCGKNEASYFYRENINGRRRELHLCEDCARSEGIANPFEQRGGDLFDLFFSPFGGLESRFFRPVVSIASGAREREQEPERPASSAAAPAQSPFARRRERNILQQRLDEAVAREDYETAITLRDQLRALDAGSEG